MLKLLRNYFIQSIHMDKNDKLTSTMSSLMSIIFMKELLLYFGLRLVIGKGHNLLIPLNYVNSVLIIIEKKEQ